MGGQNLTTLAPQSRKDRDAADTHYSVNVHCCVRVLRVLHRCM